MLKGVHQLRLLCYNPILILFRKCVYYTEMRANMSMNIVCLDLEGVLVPEIWIAFAKESGIPELTRTTRDEPDYDKLMNWRLGILRNTVLDLKRYRKLLQR